MSSHLVSIGTAVPKYRYEQDKIAEFMRTAGNYTLEKQKKITDLYKATGIKQRYSVLPDFSDQHRIHKLFKAAKKFQATVPDRMKIFREEAPLLSEQAVRDCVKDLHNFTLGQITHLITVSCTGLYAPGLDVELVGRLGLSPHVQRLGINFMGCYASFNALKAADAICLSDPNAMVLVICVELCTLHYQPSEEMDQIVSNALFADGAAAVLLSSQKPDRLHYKLKAFHCELLPAGRNEMSWDIGLHAFDMRLSAYVPALIRSGIKDLTHKLMSQIKKEERNVHYYAIHPGGRKILEVIEEQLKLDKKDLQISYQTLASYGNMSSPTVLFVLKELLQSLNKKDKDKTVLSFAFGPGLTLESMILKTCV